MGPDHIMQVGLGFWGSKTLLSAIELGVFTELANAPQDGQTLAARLGLHPRGARDFLDALVALKFLERADGQYSNTPETATFLDRARPASYLGGLLEMANSRLYGFWGSLTEALRTGQQQNEGKGGAGSAFDKLYADPQVLRAFLSAMTGISAGAAQALAEKFPWANYRTFIDIGPAQGCVPVTVAGRHPHLTGGGFDLPAVGPIFEEYVAAAGLNSRLKFYPGSFFTDPLPSADVLIMGHILHDWSMKDKRMLLAKAYDALPKDGALVVYEAIIDNDRRENAFGLLMSLNMLIETAEGFDFTGADCCGWMREAGFRDARVEHLAGPDSMVIGIK